MKDKKYKITKYLNKEGKEKYSVAIYDEWRWLFIFKIKGYYYSNDKLKGLDSLEQAKERIKKIEDCNNFVEYV